MGTPVDREGPWRHAAAAASGGGRALPAPKTRLPATAAGTKWQQRNLHDECETWRLHMLCDGDSRLDALRTCDRLRLDGGSAPDDGLKEGNNWLCACPCFAYVSGFGPPAARRARLPHGTDVARLVAAPRVLAAPSRPQELHMKPKQPGYLANGRWG